MKKLLILVIVGLLVVIGYQNKEIKQLKIDNSELEMYFDEVFLQLRWCEESLEN